MDLSLPVIVPVNGTGLLIWYIEHNIHLNASMIIKYNTYNTKKRQTNSIILNRIEFSNIKIYTLLIRVVVFFGLFGYFVKNISFIIY